MALCISSNASLANSFGLPARAQWYLVANNVTDIYHAITFAEQHHSKLMPLGSGSNIVMSPTIDACVITLQAHKWRVIDETTNHVIVTADGGCLWAQFVAEMVQAGYYGLENLANIPGTVGAAPVQNIGAYGVELSHYMTELNWVDFSCGKCMTYLADECDFSYRTSRFKQQALATGNPNGMITSVSFRLNKHFTPQRNNHRLHDLSAQCSAQELYDLVLAKRATSLPDATLGNAGSFFVNPIVDDRAHQTLLQNHPTVPCKKQRDGGWQIHAGWLIDQAGWKGYTDNIKPIGTYQHNALVLVNHAPNTDCVTGDDIRALAERIINAVERQFGVRLQQEPNNW